MRRLHGKLAAAKSAIIAGDPAATLASLDDFRALAARKGIDAADRPALEAQLTELHSLAEASLRGVRQACDDVQAIVAAARSLQTYDPEGRRRITATAAPPPHRF